MNFQFFHDRQEAIAVSLGPSRPTAQEEKEEYINRRGPHLRVGLSLAVVRGALLAGSNLTGPPDGSMAAEQSSCHRGRVAISPAI